MTATSFPRLIPLGDCAVVVHLGDEMDEPTFRQVQALARRLAASPLPGMIELVPAICTLAVYYDPLRARYDEVSRVLGQIADEIDASEAVPTRIVEIPVSYGGEFGQDLAAVADHARLTPAEVIEIHTSRDYLVHMIGFAPGFPYLGGMDERIAAPRRETPRLKIPAGSVGIAGMQTGIYPLETPGGWQIIGRTPLALFRPEHDPPTLLQAGDTVRFRAITPQEFQALREQP